MDQVDAAGELADEIDGTSQILTTCPGVAGVDADADVVVADRVPQGAVVGEVAHDGVAASRRVLDEDRHRRLEGVEGLAPAFEPDTDVLVVTDVTTVDDEPGRADRLGRLGRLGQSLAARDADAVVGRRQVHEIRSMHVDRQLGAEQFRSVVARVRLLPGLRVRQKDLHNVRVAVLRLL